MTAGLIDCIVTPKQGNRVPDGARFCADNGVFGAGYPGDVEWITWLASLDPSRCDFAVAPDVPFHAAATLHKSTPWLRVIRELGIPAAFAAQDGIEHLPIPWDAFDVLFIGGTTEWKLGRAAAQLAAEARARGKRVHMGRVNSGKRLRYARFIGCDSADGTFLVFGPDRNLPRLLSWLTECDQGDIFAEVSA